MNRRDFIIGSKSVLFIRKDDLLGIYYSLKQTAERVGGKFNIKIEPNYGLI